MTMSAKTYTITALQRWSCQDRQLPPMQQIKKIHVYDFDNTLFLSPLPNKQLWNTSTFGLLQAQDVFVNGGWWHNPSFLSATGEGLEKEEARAWEGSWNEKIVELVRLSASSEDTVSVLLTGRSEKPFTGLLGRMLKSKGLEFDLVGLKPTASPEGQKINSTMMFKQLFLRDLIYTYREADEVRVYEDRPKHTKAFRDYLTVLNNGLQQSSSLREPINAEVIQVTEQESSMSPTAEVAEVQRMINNHNQAILAGNAPPGSLPYKIKRTVFYTGYLIAQQDTDRLKTLINRPPNCPEHELRYLANNILITPRPAPNNVLKQVGGIGAKMRWQVMSVGNHQERVWAAKLAPVPQNAFVYTENQEPMVVLATRRQAKPIEASRIANWQPVHVQKAFSFETTVGEKVLLRVEKETAGENDYEAAFPSAKNTRKHSRDEDFPPLGSAAPRLRQGNADGRMPQHQGGFNGPPRGGIGFAAQRGGGAHQGRGGGKGGGGGQRNFSGPRRGGHQGGKGRVRGGYKSLDDQAGQGYGGVGAMQY
ncbi:hypothetical protein K431DRAFT_277379 [Polychaeton citri CBS 116435]|uniref:Swiss Army Knife RNA repair protein HAD domain-containing protein n=1 Tax=Polychaeton citri CBS 116435 TaxID=1314669 RepID=A0A9P4Q0M8_9PEZI|nr:hypothetical protein K431DRAFT_277379 [Polychaeton citri CBS 116435]